MTKNTGTPSPATGRRSAVRHSLKTVFELFVIVALLMGVSQVAKAGGAPSTGSGSQSVITPSASASPAVRVNGNQLVNGNNQPIRLIGVDHSGSEYACIQGWGFFDPANTDTPAMINTMKSWNINTVRVPLNEDCWLGINMSNPQWGGAAYQAAITQYVHDLNAAGLAVILDLHWNAPGSQPAQNQNDMADEDHSPAFWTSVASTFKSDPGVLFDLYNEPRNVSWGCMVNGGCQSSGYTVAGFNQLIGDVRGTGATNVVMVAGSDWAGDPTGQFSNGQGSGYPQSLPNDPLHQLAVSVHVYNFKPEDNTTVWDSWLAVSNRVPLITGEMGETDCSSSFINSYMAWADAHNVSYLGWTFNAGGGWSCSNGPSLITDYNGDPTPYGAGFKAHLAGLSVGTFTTAPPPAKSLLPTHSGRGYWIVAGDGGVFSFGDAQFHGSLGGQHLNAPVVGSTPTPDGGGYWIVAADGGVFSFGDAAFHGSTGGIHLNRPIVGMASTPDGGGYWLIASDGGVFAFGDAAFHGSTGDKHLNAPVVGAASTPDGGGYWLVASDGGIFAFGDAQFYGSTGNIHLNQPVVGMTSTPDGHGYWLVASDGGVFSYGDAAFHGSTGGQALAQPIVGIAVNPQDTGYWLVAADGGVFAFGGAPFEGSVPGLASN